MMQVGAFSRPRFLPMILVGYIVQENVELAKNNEYVCEMIDETWQILREFIPVSVRNHAAEVLMSRMADTLDTDDLTALTELNEELADFYQSNRDADENDYSYED